VPGGEQRKLSQAAFALLSGPWVVYKESAVVWDLVSESFWGVLDFFVDGAREKIEDKMGDRFERAVHIFGLGFYALATVLLIAIVAVAPVRTLAGRLIAGTFCALCGLLGAWEQWDALRVLDRERQLFARQQQQEWLAAAPLWSRIAGLGLAVVVIARSLRSAK
jgi:hypothetical protein